MFRISIIYHLLSFFLPFACEVSAQGNLPLRVELETGKDSEDYKYKVLGENGLFVFYESGNLIKDTVSWAFIHYDTNLRKLTSFTVPLLKNMHYVNSYYVQNKLYILFQQNYKKKTHAATTLLTINLSTNKFAFQNIIGFHDPNVFEIKAIDDHLILFSTTDEEDMVYFYNLSTDQLLSLAAELPIYSIEFCKEDTVQKKFLIGLAGVGANHTYPLFLCETDYNGVILKQTNFPSVSDFIYNSARIALVDSTHALIIGTYNHANEKHATSLHTGIYTIRYSDSQFSMPQFVNYTNLKYRIDAKDSLKMENAKSQNLNLQLLIGNITQSDSQYVFVTEVFYPEYNYTAHFNSYNYYSGYYNPPIPAKTLSGYRFVNAYITTFDKNGNLLWDNYLPFSNIITYSLYRKISVYIENGNVLVYYPYNFSLVFTLLHNYDVLEKLSSIPLETLNQKDVIEYTRHLNIENWYGNNFLVSGYQYLKNNTKTSKSKKYVFFLNKLIYR